MEQDPIIRELREIRRSIEEACDNDPEKYYQYILKVQERYQDRLVRREPAPALKSAKVG